MGREWELALNVGLLGRLRRDADFDLGKNTNKERLAETLFADPETIVKVLWVIVEKQAEKASVSPEEFGYGFDGSAIESAATAFMEAIIDFFHRPAVAKALTMQLPGMLTEFDARMVGATEKAIEKLKRSTLNDSAGNSPELSESIQAP